MNRFNFFTSKSPVDTTCTGKLGSRNVGGGSGHAVQPHRPWVSAQWGLQFRYRYHRKPESPLWLYSKCIGYFHYSIFNFAQIEGKLILQYCWCY